MGQSGLKARVYYCDVDAWLSNSDDSCTQLILTAIAYLSGTINQSSNRSVTVGSSVSTDTYSLLTTCAIVFSAADARHHFTALGAGNTGSFSAHANLTSYPWLRFDWNAEGNYSDRGSPAGSIHVRCVSRA